MAWNPVGNYTDDVDAAKGSEVSADLQSSANAYNAHEADTAEHGATGAVVGTTNTQTLTNKTITSSLSNTTTNPVTITADSLTTAYGLQMSLDALTTGGFLDCTCTATTRTSGDLLTISHIGNSAAANIGGLASFVSNDSDTGARNLVDIINDNTAATGAVNLRLQQDSTGDIVQWYDGATLVGRVDDVGQIIAPMLVPGQVQNLSWTKAAGVITIAGADGTALSATNPAFVCVPSWVTPGHHVTLKVTANVTFNDDDHASSNLAGWTFGVTTGVAWNNDMPIFIYALNKDDTDAGLVFGISRRPTNEGFATASIGDKDAVAATDDQNAIFVAASITEANYNSRPVTLIGATTMKKVAAADDWTITVTYTSGGSGIGNEALRRIFASSYTMPAGQNGAIANYHINNSTGANNPTWATPGNYVALYTLDRDGFVYHHYTTYNMGNCTNGAAAEQLRVYLPFAMLDNSINNFAWVFGGRALINNVTSQIEANLGAGGIAYVGINYNTFAAINALNCNNFANANDDVHLTVRYKAF